MPQYHVPEHGPLYNLALPESHERRGVPEARLRFLTFGWRWEGDAGGGGGVYSSSRPRQGQQRHGGADGHLVQEHAANKFWLLEVGGTHSLSGVIWRRVTRVGSPQQRDGEGRRWDEHARATSEATARTDAAAAATPQHIPPISRPTCRSDR